MGKTLTKIIAWLSAIFATFFSVKKWGENKAESKQHEKEADDAKKALKTSSGSFDDSPLDRM